MPDTLPRAALAAPALASPPDGAVVALDAVTFRWVAPPGASAFDLRVASASAPDVPLVDLEGLPTTETTLADALPAGDLVWWVRQQGGAWSAPGAFRAGTPADIEVAQRAEAETHALERQDEQRGVTAPGSPPPDPVWPHASGVALDGAPPPAWSRVPGFEAPARLDLPVASAEAPQVLSPLGGEVVDSVAVTLRWTAVEGATGYEVELSPDPSFDTEVLALEAGTATEIGLPGLVPAMGWRLLWRVRARLGTSVTPWSLYGRFYPAGGDAADRFRLALDEAVAAQRRQRDYQRRLHEQELDLLPLYEHEDAITTSATLVGFFGVALSGLVILTVAVLLAMIRMP